MLNVISIAQHILIALYLLLVIGFAVRVIMQRLPVGVSLAWLLVLVMIPYFGVGLYLLFGERFLGVKRSQRSARLNRAYLNARQQGPEASARCWDDCHPASEALAALEYHTAGIPPLGANRINFLPGAERILKSLIDDIDKAQNYCHMEFYIWHPGGLANQVLAALRRAAERGVVCRVMLDAVGSSEFFAAPEARQLNHANITLVKACPIGIMPWRLARYDLRNHRKTVVIDNALAYMGSFNLIDPAHFKKTAGVGQWVDMMARVEGPSVAILDAVFRWYWSIETDTHLPLLENTISPGSEPAIVQVAPSGPDVAKESILNALLQAIFSARESVDIVTPYFVPGEALEQALKIAARRGVKVRIVVPEKVDSFLVRHASHSYFSMLLEAGVNIYTYRRGLLHTKAVVIDSTLAFFGTVNMDLRSLWLNFEMTMIIYDKTVARQLADIVAGYRREAHALSLIEWRKRSPLSRFFENITHLFSPLI